MMGFAPQSRNTSAQQQEGPFKIPAGWDMGAGMTPDGGWEKLMDSVGWETGRTG